MLIAQISDFHVTANGALAYGRMATAEALERALAVLNGLKPAPDLVIGSGDLVQSGKAEEYQTLTSQLVGLRPPFAPVAGNHDDRHAFRLAFHEDGPFGPDGYIQYARDLGGLRLVVIDTVREGSDEPEFCAARADWLTDVLRSSVEPVLLVSHHPPFPAGVRWLEPRDPDWTVRLAAALDSAPGKVVHIISGHVHRAIHRTWRGIPCSTCPSTAHQVALGLGDGEPLLSREAPGFQLHHWVDGEFVTYGAAFPGFEDVFSPRTIP